MATLRISLQRETVSARNGLQPPERARYYPEPMTLSRLPWLAFLAALAYAQTPSSKEVQSVYPDAHSLYLDLHQNPELSAHETQTAAKLAARLRSAGYEVTEHVGGTGIVAILKNGTGPVIMLRTELDALPVEEKTGLPYASTVRAKDDVGRDVPVMHACGHDLHMAAILGTAEVMARSKDSWHGTLMLIGQPAEETIGGASGMLRDGLFTRFPKPDVAVALHVGNEFLPERSGSPLACTTQTRTLCASRFTAKAVMVLCRNPLSIPS
jgi:amidohydrolase